MINSYILFNFSVFITKVLLVLCDDRIAYKQHIYYSSDTFFLCHRYTFSTCYGVNMRNDYDGTIF